MAPCLHDENLILAESQALLRQGRDVAASNLLEERLAAYPHSVKLLRALAQIRMSQKRPQEAVPLLKQALAAMAGAKGYSKLFGNEDAEYLEQEHMQQINRREYDPLAEKSSPQNGQSAIANALSIPSEMDFPPILDHETGKQELINLSAEIPDLIDDLLSEEGNFVEQAKGLDSPASPGSILLPVAPVQPDEDDLSATVDENDEWETPVVADSTGEDGLWEGTPSDPAAIELPPTRRDFSDLPDRLTHAERALQIAVKVGEEFDWDQKGIRLLATINNNVLFLADGKPQSPERQFSR